MINDFIFRKKIRLNFILKQTHAKASYALGSKVENGRPGSKSFAGYLIKNVSQSFYFAGDTILRSLGQEWIYPINQSTTIQSAGITPPRLPHVPTPHSQPMRTRLSKKVIGPNYIKK